MGSGHRFGKYRALHPETDYSKPAIWKTCLRKLPEIPCEVGGSVSHGGEQRLEKPVVIFLFGDQPKLPGDMSQSPFPPERETENLKIILEIGRDWPNGLVTRKIKEFIANPQIQIHLHCNNSSTHTCNCLNQSIIRVPPCVYHFSLA